MSQRETLCPFWTRICFLHLSLNFPCFLNSAALCPRHHGETSAVGRCFPELLRISPGGQHVALSAASLHCLSGGHQHPPALFCPAVSPPGQPQHCSGGKAQRQRQVNSFYPPAIVGVSLFGVTLSYVFLLAGSIYMPLGHMLTFKVAYQIAAGLAYLHRKSIIFCDLKSDNILVWSLEVCMRKTLFCFSGGDVA